MAPGSTTSLRHPRLTAYQVLLESATAESNIWSDFLNRLPFSLGESSADRVATYSFSDSILEAFNRGLDGLIDLLRRRADPSYDRQQQAGLLADKSQRVVLWPKRYCPRTIAENDPRRQIIRLALLETPDLDGGLLESWLTSPAGGQGMFESLVALQTKALSLAYRNPTYSGVALLTHLATLSNLLTSKERICKTRVRGFTFERLDLTCGMALHACLRQAVETAIYQVGRPPAGSKEHQDLLVVLASLGPSYFVRIEDSELKEDINPYGLSPEIEQMLFPTFQSALEQGNQPRILLKAMMRQARREGPLRTSLMQHAGSEQLRRLILDHLVAAEDPAEEHDRQLAEYLPSNQALISLMETRSGAGDIAVKMTRRSKDRRHRDDSWRESQRLIVFMERIRDHGPPWKAPREEDQQSLQNLIERFLLHRMDEFAQSHVDQARKRVIDRRKSSSTVDLRREYSEGRLYRLAADDKPLIYSRVVQEEGQLFVDLKGYTRRTAAAKEVVMAEFLKTSFYEPILNAARSYYGGAQLMGRDQSIQLVNLLGDAVAFSGNIESLVSLARDIQEIFLDYRKRLLELSAVDEEPSVRDAARKIALRRQEIGSRRDKLERELGQIKKEVFRRSSMSSDEKVVQLQQDYKERFEHTQQSYRKLQQQEKQTSDLALRAQLGARIDGIRHAYSQIKEHRQVTLERLKLLKGDKLEQALTDQICHSQLEKIRDIENHLRSQDDEVQSLNDAQEEDRQRRGGGLEAGLFISFGTAAEVISMDDDVWGDQRVAVSERINEAARGTARNLVVKKQIERMLAQARDQPGLADLQLPFRVYVADTGTFQVDHELGQQWQKALADQDNSLMETFVADLVKSVRNSFAAGCADPANLSANDIYNLGEAMSAKALDSYLRQTRTTHHFYRVQIRPHELDRDIRQRFFFQDQVISLIIGSRLQSSRDELVTFRYVGQVLFRGFEGTLPTPVFEILRQDSGFMRLLRKHHVDSWSSKARQNPHSKLESLEELSDPGCD